MNSIVLVDDHDIYRSNLKLNLKDLNIVGEAVDYPSALELIERVKPDLVILGFSQAFDGNVSIISDIISRHPSVKILVLTIYDWSGYATAALARGAAGYCLKYEAIDEINRAISAVLRGERYISPHLTDY